MSMILVKWYSKQRLIFVAIVLLVVVGGLWFWLAAKSKPDVSASVEDALTAANEFTQTGDYDQALLALQHVQTQTRTKDEKVRVLNDLAAAAANTGQVQAALDYYDQKHQLDPGSKASDGSLTGELYERLGNTAKAIESYQLYLDYLKANPPQEDTQGIAISVEAHLQELKAAQP